MVTIIQYLSGLYDIRWNGKLVLHAQNIDDVIDIINACKKSGCPYKVIDDIN